MERWPRELLQGSPRGASDTLRLGPAYLVEMRQGLSRFYRGLQRLRAENGYTPAPNSPAAVEFAVGTRQETLFTARSNAVFLIESGGEHLTAFVKMVTEPVEPIACWTCIRTLLEACARAAWILDPAIDGAARVRRAFAIQFAELSQDIKCAKAMGQSEAVLNALRVQVEQVERDAVALGYPELRDAEGRRIGIGQRLPSATEVIRDCLAEESAYRILSAVTHGQVGTIRQLSYGFAPPAVADTQIGGVKVAHLRKTVNVNYLAWLALIAARAVARPVWFDFTYCGWDRGPLEGLLEEVFDELGARPEPRFWRQ